jgi:hypothetical protein
MVSHRGLGWLRQFVLVAAVLLGLSGCFLMGKWQPGRPDPEQSVSGPAVRAESCPRCHEAERASYAQSRHAAVNIRCGQCHTPGGHPNFADPVQDATCAGCHQSAFDQTLKSRHFADRQLRPLDGDLAARVTLRKEGFIATTAAGRRFVGDSASGALGGRLCVACHYDEHRLGLGAVRQAGSCLVCHPGFEQHFASVTASPGQANRCTQCHVRVTRTEAGQTVNTHEFVSPGKARARR